MPYLIVLSFIAILTIPSIAEAENEGFVDGAKVNLLLRNYFINKNYVDASAPQNYAREWTQNFILDLKSGYTTGPIGFGVDGLGLWSVKLEGGKGTTGTGFTRRAIGYPSNEVLKSWIREFYPNSRPLIIRSGTNKCFSPEERSQAVRELCSRRGTALKVAQDIGVSVPVLYIWSETDISI